MELPRAFDGNGLLRRNACAAVSSITRMGGEPRRKFADTQFSHFHLGGIRQKIAPKLLLDIPHPLCFMGGKDLAVSRSAEERGGIYFPRFSWTDLGRDHDRAW